MIIHTLVRWIFAVFYGLIVSIVTIFSIIRHGNSYFKRKIRDTTPEILQDISLGKHACIKLKNLKIHYVTTGDIKNPLMLLLHGFPEFWFSWRYQLKEFSKDYWLVAIDLPGYGNSEKPKGIQAYTSDELTLCLKELIVALGRQKAIVVGHDWGGILAWYLAGNYPDVVDKLVVMNAPHPGHFEKVLFSSLKQFLMCWYIFFFQLPLLPEFVIQGRDMIIFDEAFKKDGQPIWSSEEIEAYKYTFSRPGALTPPINFYRAAMARIGTNIESKNVHIRVPTLMVWGEKDKALSLQLATGCVRFVDDFTLRIVENASHWVQTEQPDEVNRHVWDFLNKTRNK
ncbi:epoxide hydrolase 4-like [Limulus polyphemus]|uniref:Epoxide hydrolase 4-like n=1 Tax=Limulus polyphemus TaxID=6850 RepID=A0ABM1BDV8_LIMPO|nr:epoxide hydrolase 4-like [Limulus polyphemus]